MRRVLLGSLALLLVLVGGTTWFMWPRDDVPQDPDAVVVLGGAGSERAELGLELAERYDAQLVLSSSAAIFGERLGATCGEDAYCFEPAPPTTIGEARNIGDLATERGWEHVTVATSRFHTTRTRVLFEQCLGDESVSVVGAVRADGSSGVGVRRWINEIGGTVAGSTVLRAC